MFVCNNVRPHTHDLTSNSVDARLAFLSSRFFHKTPRSCLQKEAPILTSQQSTGTRVKREDGESPGLEL